MSEAVWMPDDVAAAEVPAGVSDPPHWLPESIRRRQALEDAADQRIARAAARERADADERAHDGALQAYRAAAERRGDVFDVLSLATGEGIGRTAEDVFRDMLAISEDEDARAAARDKRAGVSRRWRADDRAAAVTTTAGRGRHTRRTR